MQLCIVSASFCKASVYLWKTFARLDFSVPFKGLSGSEFSSDVFLKSALSGILYLKSLAEGLSLPSLPSSPFPPHNPCANKLMPGVSTILLPCCSIKNKLAISLFLPDLCTKQEKRPARAPPANQLVLQCSSLSNIPDLHTKVLGIMTYLTEDINILSSIHLA